MEIPGLEYFQNNNIFSGSKQNFNFKIFPKDDRMEVKIWLGPFCMDKSEVIDQNEFSLTDTGHSEMIQWLEERYIKCSN